MFKQNCINLTYTCTRATILVIVVYVPRFMWMTYREPLNTGVYSAARGGCRGASDVTARGADVGERVSSPPRAAGIGGRVTSPPRGAGVGERVSSPPRAAGVGAE